MPRLRFTDNIQRHVACPPCNVDGPTVRDALDAYFDDNDSARGYVLDDQQRLRKHMAIFINGIPVRDREQLSDKVQPNDTIDVMQALSGG